MKLQPLSLSSSVMMCISATVTPYRRYAPLHMFALEIIKLGLANLRLHFMRSVLTALGIILGVAAVITMVSIGEGSKRLALEQLERLGARNLIVRSVKPAESEQAGGGQARSFVIQYGITYEDFRIVESAFPDAESIVPLKSLGSPIIRGDRRRLSQVFGTTPDLQSVAGLRLKRGRYLNEQDMESDELVAVIGSEVARSLFPDDDPLDNTFRIDQQAVRVVGLLEPIGLSGGAGAALVGRDMNFDVHIPITTAKRVFGDVVVRRESGSFSGSEVHVEEIFVALQTREEVLVQSKKLRRLFESRNPKMEDIELIVPYELLENARKSAMTWNLVLGAVAGISLLVGGIGIMNIMLATVTERTREIGIRRALGATRRHIETQFLVETGVLSAAGVIGVILGVSLSLGIEWFVPRLPAAPLIGSWFPEDIVLPTAVTGWSIVVSFAVAAATGLIFGIYPATVASKQDPIVALRHD